MKLKKCLVVGSLCAVLASVAAPITVSAHHGGGHHRYSSSYYDYDVCTVRGCHRTTNHRHNGITYSSRCIAYGHSGCY